jgi:hypothetical protein
MSSLAIRAVRAVALIAGLPLYIGGSLAVVILPLNQMNNPTHDLSFGVIFGVTTFLLGTALLAAGSTGYVRWRLAACLLLPPLFLAIGIAATPGNLAPWAIIVSFLAAGAVIFVLLRGWARRGEG